MARRNKYLGKSVKDIRKKGLDSIQEVRGIVNHILKDYKDGKISYKTAMSRLNLMELIIARDSDFTFNARKERRAREIVEKARTKLKRLKALRKARSVKKRRKLRKKARKKRRRKSSYSIKISIPSIRF